MPVNWIVRSVERNNGLVQVHMSLDAFPHGQPEEIWLNISPERLGDVFMEGDERSVSFALVARAGQNGVGG